MIFNLSGLSNIPTYALHAWVGSLLYQQRHKKAGGVLPSMRNQYSNCGLTASYLGSYVVKIPVRPLATATVGRQGIAQRLKCYASQRNAWGYALYILAFLSGGLIVFISFVA